MDHKIHFRIFNQIKKVMDNRSKALEWFNIMSLEKQFYLTIEANHLLLGDTVERHPKKLTGREIEIIYNFNFDNSSIVRTNMLNDKDYTCYCGSELCIPRRTQFEERWPRTKFNGTQFECPKCNWESKYPEVFINTWKEKHNIK